MKCTKSLNIKATHPNVQVKGVQEEWKVKKKKKASFWQKGRSHLTLHKSTPHFSETAHSNPPTREIRHHKVLLCQHIKVHIQVSRSLHSTSSSVHLSMSLWVPVSDWSLTSTALYGWTDKLMNSKQRGRRGWIISSLIKSTCINPQ